MYLDIKRLVMHRDNSGTIFGSETADCLGDSKMNEIYFVMVGYDSETYRVVTEAATLAELIKDPAWNIIISGHVESLRGLPQSRDIKVGEGWHAVRVCKNRFTEVRRMKALGLNP